MADIDAPQPAAPGSIEMAEIATILIVDDDAMNRFLIAEALAMDGHRTVEADSGEAALAAVTAAMPDLILLDIDMPGMGGLAACRAIRALPNGGLTPIMMVTGLNDTASVEAAFESGATDFLAKPLHWVLMRQRVRFLLRHNTIARRLHRNEKVLEQVHSLAKIGHWDWDLVAGVMYSSPQQRKMFPTARAFTPGIGLNHEAKSLYARLILEETRRAVAAHQSSFTAEHSLEINGCSVRWLSHAQIEYDGATPVRAIGSIQDVTQRYLNEERYTAIFNNSPVGIVEANYRALQSVEFDSSETALREQLLQLERGDLAPLQVLKANPAALRILGIDRLSNQRLRELGIDCMRALIKALQDGRTEAHVQAEMPLADGIRHLSIRLPVPRTHAELQRMVVSIIDVTELVQREERLRRADKIIEHSSDGVALISREHHIYSINPAFEHITGYTLAELHNHSFQTLIANSSNFSHSETAISSSVRAEGSWRGEAEFVHRDGRRIPILVKISTILDDAGEVSGYVTMLTDVTYLKESERRLFHLAHYDALTGLPNRLSLQESLKREFDGGDQPRTQMALLYIDLDGFKLVNDSMGHTTGDALLADVSKRLQATVRPEDLLARIGGDEFALLMRAAPDQYQIITQANALLAVLGTPFVIQEREIFIGASIGACIYPDNADNAADMLRNADTAMYEAKRLGRDQLCFYSDELTSESSRRLGIENGLRSAIASGQLFLQYQPKYDATSTAMVGAEALVRWRSPTRGVVPPNDFIGIAEESGLIVALGEWVIHEACRQMAAWRRDFGIDISVAINISALHLRQHSLLQVVAAAIARFEIDPKLLEIEITEDSLDFRGVLDDSPYAVLNALSAMGVSIAIDDFGTGYSSLSQLKKMPISTLKIDRSFVRDIASDESDYAIITAIVGLAKTLGMHIVAEGVETEQQAQQLRKLQCDVFQGFLYSRPLDPADFMTRFVEQTSRGAT